MFKKLIGKVLHSIEHSKSGPGRHGSSSAKDRRRMARSSSSRRGYAGHSSSDARHSGGRHGHKHYKNRSGSSS
ncbi:hypothetical protein [Paenibacillus donghaensis]|uniref:Uncharacterized protein n=1 Tax=Paenibacillus donghaensis TaxID=414771 RepID=A0A2Z2KB72_9BACL|nr:hypothetical protein [Paenibacillus donghaensis]ASA20885.1 hypothetical protein B9T62_08875 [Paenibacillus donghaensis]